jgi:4-alpha-glucanotransferase
MAVLQFAPGGGRRNPHRPANHRPDLVVYTGTHDTPTTVGWWETLPPRRRARTALDPAEPNWSLIRVALSSPAAISILPAQDVLGLDNSARMNWPGTTDPRNWTWRLEPGQLTESLAARLRGETLAARRTRRS